MSGRGKPPGRGTAVQKAPLTGIDRAFGRDIRSVGWVVDLETGSGGNAARGADRERVGGPLLPAMMWALRARRK